MKVFNHLVGIISSVVLLTSSSLAYASDKVLTTIFNKKNEVILEIKESDISKYT